MSPVSNSEARKRRERYREDELPDEVAPRPPWASEIFAATYEAVDQ